MFNYYYNYAIVISPSEYSNCNCATRGTYRLSYNITNTIVLLCIYYKHTSMLCVVCRSITNTYACMVLAKLTTCMCWLVVEQGHARAQRLDRSDERSNRESERTKGKGEMSTLTPLFPIPHF